MPGPFFKYLLLILFTFSTLLGETRAVVFCLHPGNEWHLKSEKEHTCHSDDSCESNHSSLYADIFSSANCQQCTDFELKGNESPQIRSGAQGYKANVPVAYEITAFYDPLQRDRNHYRQKLQPVLQSDFDHRPHKLKKITVLQI